MRRHHWSFITVAFLALILETQAHALTFSCAVTVTGINFGVYNPLSTTADSATGTYSVKCTASGIGVEVISGTLSLSTGSSGKFSTRTLLSGTTALNYNIYMSSSYSQIVGDGTQGTSQVTASGLVIGGQVYQVGGSFYGLIPAGQDVAAGSYSDTIMVTVAY